MATPKPETQINQHTITATFTDEEYELLETFAAEQGIENLSDAIPALLHELISVHDALWDKQFENLPPALIEMGRKALEDHKAGLTEEIDTDSL